MAALFLVVGLAALVSTVLYLRAVQARRRSDEAQRAAEDALAEAETQRRTSEAISGFLQDMFTRANPTLTQSREELTVSEVITNPAEFRKVPGYEDGIVPWWPGMTPPDEMAERDDDEPEWSLIEVEPAHWVACWRTEYVAHHPITRPDIDYRRGN